VPDGSEKTLEKIKKPVQVEFLYFYFTIVTGMIIN